MERTSLAHGLAAATAELRAEDELMTAPMVEAPPAGSRTKGGAFAAIETTSKRTARRACEQVVGSPIAGRVHRDIAVVTL